MQTKGLGAVKEMSGRANRLVFYKLPGSQLDESNATHKYLLKNADMTVLSYTDNFNNTSHVSQSMLDLFASDHPQAEEILNVTS